MLRQLRTPGRRFAFAASGTRRRNGVGAIRLLDMQQKVERATGIRLASYGGVVANSYLLFKLVICVRAVCRAQVDDQTIIR